MTDYEAGYLQALKDVQTSVRQVVNDPGTSPEGKVELLGVVSLLDDMIRANSGPQDEPDPLDAPDPIGGSF